MANFVNDYSNLAGAGAAFNSFASAYQDAQDRQTKKQEAQAKMASMSAQMDRDATDQALKLRASGAQKNPLTGQLEDAPLSMKAQNDQAVGIAEKGLNPLTYDESGKVNAPTWNPSSPQIIGAHAKQVAAGNSGLRGQAAMEGIDIRRDSQSAQAVDKIHKNKELQGMQQQARMIDKGLELTSDPKNPPSVVAMHEFAQDVSAALSGKAASSDMKLRSISTPTVREKLANLEGYITSNPNQPAPPDVVKFWNDMGNRLKDAYGRQMSAKANELAKQGDTVYRHNPSAQKAQHDAAQMYKDGSWRGEVDDSQSPQAPAQQAPAQGLVPPQQGFLGKMAGLVTGGGQQAAPAKPQTVIQNGHTYTLNPKTGQYE